MPILDPQTLAAARGITTSTLSDTATIYTPSNVDNGLGLEKSFGLRDVQLCRVVSLNAKDVSDALRQLNKQLYHVTMASSATIDLNEKVEFTGSVNFTGYVVQTNADQTDDVVANTFVVASGS